MNILYFSFYFEPDLCAGSFRNTPLVEALAAQLSAGDHIHVVTTQPNRYKTFQVQALFHEEKRTESGCRITIDRVAIPTHTSGFVDQARSFVAYYYKALRQVRRNRYDLVFASSSRLFTAFLGARVARSRRIPLSLDIRDLFRETILEILKNPVGRWGLDFVLRGIETYTFGYARHINLVSEGFRNYFDSYKQAHYTYHTNGIDDAFLAQPAHTNRDPSQPLTLVYAGNIGEGQGLHKIIPQAARRLGNAYRFIVVGDGGAMSKLLEAMKTEVVFNVEVRNPVSRNELIALYQRADYLFVHLNDLEAFKRVLPSKLFEYGATSKPIVAGVAGYARSFLLKYVDNCLVFNPGDVDSMVEQLRAQTPVYRSRDEFREQFQRKTIMRELAKTVLQTAEKRSETENPSLVLSQ
ncbi:glycosyltransferase family 4 protein [Larkinella bovis]|uniref:Glycosyltransferase family 4 protein n=1 Tax=Larkinella bovis TaxID=683041 RepID=A0ABW0I9K2_9BACT